MSLILTTISRRGIVHASDSNLSSATGPAGTGQKVFEVPALCAALSVAGAYSVSNVSMAAWFPATINQFMSQSDPRLGAFGRIPAQESRATDDSSREGRGSLMHLCGYVPSAGRHCPSSISFGTSAELIPRRVLYPRGVRSVRLQRGLSDERLPHIGDKGCDCSRRSTALHQRFSSRADRLPRIDGAPRAILP